MKTWEQGEADYIRETRTEWVYSKSGVREIERYVHLGFTVASFFLLAFQKFRSKRNSFIEML